MTKTTNTELAQVARAALDWIDALPSDVAASMPTMPGFDRNWAENAISDAQYVQQKYENAMRELAAARQQIEALAAENAKLKTWSPDPRSEAMLKAIVAAERLANDGMNELALVEAFEILKLKETPATDAAMAEIRAQGRIEGINFAASRLAAAFNHGFVEKPMAEVGDVVRMILTAKEDLANNPAEDGLSGEYAEQSLKDWEQQLRAEASK